VISSLQVFATVGAYAASLHDAPPIWKVREPGVQLTTDPSPVPVRLTLGLAVALLAIVRFPDLLPTEGGVKVTLTVQLAPAARLVPELFICAHDSLATMLWILIPALTV